MTNFNPTKNPVPVSSKNKDSRKISCSTIGEAIVLSNLVLFNEKSDLRGYLLDRRIQSFRVLAYWLMIFLKFNVFDDDPLYEKIDYFFPLSTDIRTMLQDIEEDFDSSIMWGQTVDDQLLKKAKIYKESFRIATNQDLDYEDVLITEVQLENLITCTGNILCPKVIFTAREYDLYNDIYHRSRLWARDILSICFDVVGDEHVFSHFISDTIFSSGKFEEVIEFNGDENPGRLSEPFESTWERLWIDSPKYLNNHKLKKVALLDHHSIYAVGNLSFAGI